jgi:uncharacterized membrane protein YphA (DoxX/SURF4 family)
VDANVWLWILAGFLALVFLGTGILKLTRTRAEIVEQGLAWAEDYSEPTLRMLGWAEVVGAVALVAPPFLRIGVLVPIAAVALGLLMVGALVVHVRRRELLPDALRTLALIVMCGVLAGYRFGPEAF